MVNKKTFPNRLGVLGWLAKGRWGLERYLYILHRISGLGILTYFLLHIFVTSMRLGGKDVWTQTMAAVSYPVFVLGEFAVFAAFAFHMVNGIRLILIEFGIAVGKAEEPVYPYKSSLNTQRPLMIVSMIIVAMILIAGGYRYLMLH